MSHSYWRPADGDKITLEVSSNCVEVELFRVVGGKSVSLGVKKNNFKDDKKRNKFLWQNIAWHPGRVVAVARDNGKEVARHELRSHGKAARLMATVGKTDDLKADGMELIYVRLQMVDAHVVEVDNYDGKVAV